MSKEFNEQRQQVFFNIGVDIGNSNVKTPNITFPSGFTTSNSKPFGNTDWICINNTYYELTERRFPYVKDKTLNDNMFILTLFAIAKDITQRNATKPKGEIQQWIDRLDSINLCVGLPPAHMNLLKAKTIRYYNEKFADGVRFTYNDLKFSFTLGLCEVVPQDFAAISCVLGKEGDSSIPNKYKEYYAIDFGGATVDIVPIRNGKPQTTRCDSLEMGVIQMYDNINSYVEREYGVNVAHTLIEDVLRGEETAIDPEIIDDIKKMAEKWLNDCINELVQRGVTFNTSPVVFVGGGAQMFKESIEKNKTVRTYEFLGDERENATGYQRYLKSLVESKRRG